MLGGAGQMFRAGFTSTGTTCKSATSFYLNIPDYHCYDVRKDCVVVEVICGRAFKDRLCCCRGRLWMSI